LANVLGDFFDDGIDQQILVVTQEWQIINCIE